MRKKTILLLITCLFFGGGIALAQEQGGGSGGLTLELNASFYTEENAPRDRLYPTPHYLKARYFVTDEIVPRVSFWFDFTTTENTPGYVSNRSIYTIRPGVEYHLVSSPGSFSAYAGADAILDFVNYSFENEEHGITVTGSPNDHNPGWTTSPLYDRGFSAYGAVVFGGADIYIGDNLFVGSEFGIAYKIQNHSEVVYNGFPAIEKSTSSSIRIDLSRVFRIGFLID